MSIVAVVPDIHGRADLLERVLARVWARHGRGVQLLFLGDLIDRGDGSAAVLRRVQGLSREGAAALCGNHEEVFLQFLGGNPRAGLRFAYNGGAETVDSFVREHGAPFASYQNLKAYLERDGLYGWLAGLPHHVQLHGVSATHAPVAREHWVAGAPPRQASLWNSPQTDDPLEWAQCLWAEGQATPVCGHVTTPLDGTGRRRPVRAGRGWFLDCGSGDEPDCELIAGIFEQGAMVEVLRSG